MRYAIRSAAIFAITFSLSLPAADIEWTSTNGDWSDPSNWSSNPALPGPADDVTVDVVGSRLITHGTGTSVIQNLNLGEQLQIRDGSTVTITSEANFLPGSRLSFQEGGSLVAGAIPTLDGVGLSISGNSVSTQVSFPDVTSVTNLHQGAMNWTASGPLGVLSFPNLTSLTHNDTNFRNINVSAQLGGHVDLSQLTEAIRVASFSDFIVSATNGGTVDISSFTGIPHGQLNTLTVGAGSAVIWASPQVVTDMDLTIGGILNTTPMTDFRNGILTIEKVTAPHEFSNLSNADGATVAAGGILNSGILSLPSLVTYTNTADSDRQFRARGASSVLSLSNLTTMTGSSTNFQDITVEAIAAGQVNLENLTTINRPNIQTQVSFVSTGTGSHIDISGFHDYLSGSVTSVQVLDGASLDWANPGGGDGIELVVGGALPTGQIQSWTNGTVQAGNNLLPAPDFSSLTNADGSSLVAGILVDASGHLTLPGLTNYTHSSLIDVRFEAVEAGSQLDLSSLESLTMSPMNFTDVLIRANRGGFVDLRSLTQISKPNALTLISVDVREQGSMVDISGLQGFEDSQLDSIMVEPGSSLIWSNPSTIANLELEVGGTIQTSQIITFLDGSLTAINETQPVLDFTGLVNANGSSLSAGNGTQDGVLLLSRLAHYENSGAQNVRIRSVGDGSELHLPAITSIFGSNDRFTTTLIEARSHGSITLNSGRVAIEQNIQLLVDHGALITAGTIEARQGALIAGDGEIQADIDLNGGYLQAGNLTFQRTLNIGGQVLARNGGQIRVPEDAILISASTIQVASDGKIGGGGDVENDVRILAEGALAADLPGRALQVHGSITLEQDATLSVTDAYGQARPSLSGEFVVATADGGVTGILDIEGDSGLESHLGRGYFLESVTLSASDVTIEIYAAIPGDANGDKSVDVSDFNLWNANKFSSAVGWTSGDFNDDGFVDVADFNIWNANKFAAFNPMTSVPESTGLTSFALIAVCLAANQRSQRSRRSQRKNGVR